MTSLHILGNGVRAPTQDDLLCTVRNNQGMQNHVPTERLEELVESTSPAKIPRGPYIALERKLLPSEQTHRISENSIESKESNVVHTGTADISALQQKLKGMTEDMWEDSMQRSHGNATLTRAAHDRLGIRKIVFIFSDDILTTVMRHPWWKTWQNELRPIFESVNINPNRLIRCMLARIPPKTHIGVHHDTGRWTTLSHRMHIPIFTNVNKVVFRSGNNVETMERFAFQEGECFELNNRAKHQVYNGWDQHRVHLIFDWVSDDVASKINFITLSKGQNAILSRRAFIGLNEQSEEVKTSSSRDSNTQDEMKKARKGDSIAPALASRSLIAKPKDVVKGTNMLWQQLLDFFRSDPNKSSDPEGAAALGRAKQFFVVFKQYCLGEILIENLVHAFRQSLAQKGFLNIDNDFMCSIESNLVLACSDSERRHRLQAWFKSPGTTRDLNMSPLQYQMKQNLSRPPMFQELSENPLPNFIILGMMKCGTTSLFEYIMDHPYACPGRQKEPHLFDWRYERITKAKLTTDQSEKAKAFLKQRGLEQPTDFQCKITCFFDVDTMATNERFICGDGSPSYVMGGKLLARRVQASAPNSRYIMILRDPVKRCCSHYNMMKDKGDKHLGNKSFKEVVLSDIEHLRRCGVNPEDGVDNIDLDVFERDYLRSLPYGHGSHSYVGRGLYVLLIKIWIHEVKRENILILRLEEMVRDVQGTMDVVYEYLGLPPHLVENTNPRNSRGGGYKVDFNDAENAEVLQILSKFYHPFQEALLKLVPTV